MSSEQIYLSIGVLTFLLGLYKITNGRMKNVEQNKVSRDSCHEAQNGVKQRIDDLDKHLSERFEDLKDFMIKNGKK